MQSNAIFSKILILHNIRSAQNVGSLFRTADAVGIEKVFLSSITPQPVDRFGREVGAITKTALGAEKNLAWQNYENLEDLLQSLKKEGFQIIAIEQSLKAVDYKNIKSKEKIAFILGNEVEGLKAEILQLVDVVAEIPMQGDKESLNVAVAGGVAMYRILNV